MSAEPTKPKTAAAAVAQLVDLLSGLPPEEQSRAIDAALILLGIAPSSASRQLSAAPLHPDTGAVKGVSEKAVRWMRQYGLDQDRLEHAFSISADGVEIIAASMPGRSKRQQTLEAYLVCGLRSFLKSGETLFADREARDLCDKVGCYDSPNHANYVSSFGNLVSGSKDAGWKVTNPGLARAADTVKALASLGP